MATLILQSAGAALGGLFGGPIGAMFGRTLGGLAGSAIDRDLFGSTVMRDGSRLTDMPGLSSTEGAPIPRLYGRARLGGQLIWATRFLETSEMQSAGGKGLGGAPTVESRTYIYHANFAIGLTEGPIAYVRRIWADGKLLDWANLTVRVYCGDEDQHPDPLIIAKESASNAPAYRGLAYIVFENFLLTDYGNRIPQFSFEIIKPVDGVRQSIRAINLIPGAGEFIYDPQQVTATTVDDVTDLLTRHQLVSQNDFDASIDQLLALCPNLTTVQLVVTWFGDDLRAGLCRITPKIDARNKVTRETEWMCAGETRDTALLVSQYDGQSAFGGTPSDPSVVRAVRALKARGLKVVIYPFIMMDIPTGNTLPDPWRSGSSQPPYPWRGRITTDRAIGRSDTTDMTAQVDQEIDAIFGTLPANALRRQGDTVLSQQSEFSLRRIILHYAVLLADEGLDGIIIGSELCGLTKLRNANGVFPAVQKLMALAGDIRSLLPPQTKILYAADWTEYGSYVAQNGDVYFPLDPLFAHSAISAIGIDAYWPLTDWRSGPLHKDRSLASTIYDPNYLTSRFAAGEDFDWYYANHDSGFAAPSYNVNGSFGYGLSISQLSEALNFGDINAQNFGGYGVAIIADLNTQRYVDQIAIAPIAASYNWGGIYATNLDISISTDGLEWSFIGKSPMTVLEGVFTFISINRIARYVKLQPTYSRENGADYWIGLSKFRVSVQSDRDAQLRTLITDGAYNEPWIYRSKDLVNWWSNPHYERIGGVRSQNPTAWVPQSKPIYLTEFGCPAVDRGSNAPNVFPDPKSAENAKPYYSRGSRDDLIQYRVLEAFYRRFNPEAQNFALSHNPKSTIYNSPMLDISSSAIWAWDARPFPEFPNRIDLWSDGQNYETGHWLNGRLEGVAVDGIIRTILRDFDLPDADIDVHNFIDGYVIDRPMSARAALEPLAALFGFSATARPDKFIFFTLGSGTTVALDEDDALPLNGKGHAEVTRAQESELPQELRIGYMDADRLYRASNVNSRRLSKGAKGILTRDAPVVMRQSSAQYLADLALNRIWSNRETAKLRVRPGLRSLEPGDMIKLDELGHEGLFCIDRITDAAGRVIEAHAIDPSLDDQAEPITTIGAKIEKPVFAGVPQAIALTVPPISSSPMTTLAIAATARPWSGPIAIWRSVEGAAFSLFGSIDQPARIGRTLSAFGPGPVWRFDYANRLDAKLPGAVLSSRSEVDALSAKPALAIEGDDGLWEIISYQNADLIGPNQYRFSKLLRGLGGTEALASRQLAPGQSVVLLDQAIKSLAQGSDHLGEAWALRLLPSGLEVSDPTALEMIVPIEGLALKPLAPAHAEARRSSNGITMSFIRRARENSDNWGIADIALDEADERYDIEILKQGQVVRVLAATEPVVLYPAALELDDFTQAQTSLSIRIYQLSRAVGRGAACDVTLIIR